MGDRHTRCRRPNSDPGPSWQERRAMDCALNFLDRAVGGQARNTCLCNLFTADRQFVAQASHLLLSVPVPKNEVQYNT